MTREARMSIPRIAGWALVLVSFLSIQREVEYVDRYMRDGSAELKPQSAFLARVERVALGGAVSELDGQQPGQPATNKNDANQGNASPQEDGARSSPLKRQANGLEEKQAPQKPLQPTEQRNKESSIIGQGTARPKYYELNDQIRQIPTEKDPQGKLLPRTNALSAYSRARVVKQRTPWFPKRKLCKATCCVETIAISLDQDEHKIINGRDGRDVADIILEKLPNKREPFLKYHASNLQEDMIPCLLPGTIVFIHNHNQFLRYFWHTLRPKIHVNYTLVVSGSDGNTPSVSVPFWSDPLLQKYYGTNPKHPNHPKHPEFRDHLYKYQSFALGLGTQYPQERHILPYLQWTNFSNPFWDKSQWDFQRQEFHWDADVFVHFNPHKDNRKHLWKVLCPHSTSTNHPNEPSCNANNRKLPVHDIYTGMSKYRFGISPRGFGFDCYRTYELLLLGVIPIIDELDPEGYELFEGLPVVHMPHMNEATSQQDFVDAIENYIASEAFQNSTFDKGWDKLFLKYKRQMLLKDTGRDQEILVDEKGRQYYQAYHYTVLNASQDLACRYGCDAPNKQVDAQWLQDIGTTTKLKRKDRQFLDNWKRLGGVKNKRAS